MSSSTTITYAPALLSARVKERMEAVVRDKPETASIIVHVGVPRDVAFRALHFLFLPSARILVNHSALRGRTEEEKKKRRKLLCGIRVQLAVQNPYFFSFAPPLLFFLFLLWFCCIIGQKKKKKRMAGTGARLFQLYTLVTLVVTAAGVWYAYFTRQQFYTAALFMSTNKVRPFASSSPFFPPVFLFFVDALTHKQLRRTIGMAHGQTTLVLLGNFVFMLVVAFGRLLQLFFLGQLRRDEVEEIVQVSSLFRAT